MARVEVVRLVVKVRRVILGTKGDWSRLDGQLGSSLTTYKRRTREIIENVCMVESSTD